MLKSDNISIGKDFAKKIKSLYPKKSASEIANILGLKIVFEKPVESNFIKRISEFRPKIKEIAVFYKDYFNNALLHEIFHYLENENGVKLEKRISEREAREFVSAFNKE